MDIIITPLLRKLTNNFKININGTPDPLEMSKYIISV